MDSDLADLREDVAKILTTVEQWKINIDRFYAKDWAQLTDRVGENEARLRQLEHRLMRLEGVCITFEDIKGDVKQLGTEIENLSLWRAEMRGMLVASSSIAGIVCGVVFSVIQALV